LYNVCVQLIGGAVINFAVGENILPHNLKGLVPISFVAGYITRCTVIAALIKIDASNKAACLRSKEYFL